MLVFILAFAQPSRIVRTAKQRATVVLTLDTSGSMVATDVTPDRLQAAEQAARDFVQALPSGIQIGLVQFSTEANVLASRRQRIEPPWWPPSTGSKRAAEQPPQPR